MIAKRLGIPGFDSRHLHTMFNFTAQEHQSLVSKVHFRGEDVTRRCLRMLTFGWPLPFAMPGWIWLLAEDEDSHFYIDETGREAEYDFHFGLIRWEKYADNKLPRQN